MRSREDFKKTPLNSLGSIKTRLIINCLRLTQVWNDGGHKWIFKMRNKTRYLSLLNQMLISKSWFVHLTSIQVSF